MAGNGGARVGAGRPKGSVNKTTAVAKDVISQVAQGLGGAEGMLEWAQKEPANTRIFWGQIYPKLLPHQLTGADGESLTVNLLQFTPKK